MDESLFEKAVQHDINRELGDALDEYRRCIWKPWERGQVGSRPSGLPDNLRYKALFNSVGILHLCLDFGFECHFKPPSWVTHDPLGAFLLHLAWGRREFGDRRDIAIWEEYTLCWPATQFDWSLRRWKELDSPDQPHPLVELGFFWCTLEFRNRSLLIEYLESLPQQQTCFQNAIGGEIKCALQSEERKTEERERNRRILEQGQKE